MGLVTSSTAFGFCCEVKDAVHFLCRIDTVDVKGITIEHLHRQCQRWHLQVIHFSGSLQSTVNVKIQNTWIDKCKKCILT